MTRSWENCRVNCLDLQFSQSYNSAVHSNSSAHRPYLNLRRSEACTKGSMNLRSAPFHLAQMHLSAFAVLFLLPALPAAASRDTVPDWVHAAASQKLPAYPAETNAVVLLDDTTYTVAPDGTAIEHYRHVVKILRPQGREEGIVAVPFDKDTKIRSFHVWSIGPRRPRVRR
jgi:hypothetical protein